MTNVLKDYAAVYLNTRDKAHRHAKMQEWIKREYNLLPTFSELQDFMLNIEDSVKIGFPFQRKVIYPVCKDEIFNNRNIHAAKLILFHCNPYEFLNYACGDSKGEGIDLLKLALDIAPCDPELLQKKYENDKSYYTYTLHEVPWGVLYDSNGASIDQTRKMLHSLEEFQQLCGRLGHDEGELIAKCRHYYSLWIDYLSSRDSYSSFSECINAFDGKSEPAQ